MPTALTRWIQRRNGHRVVPGRCASCGVTRPNVASFPRTNILGLGGLLWATQRGRSWFGRSLRCPTCGEPLSVEEEHGREPGPGQG